MQLPRESAGNVDASRSRLLWLPAVRSAPNSCLMLCANSRNQAVSPAPTLQQLGAGPVITSGLCAGPMSTRRPPAFTVAAETRDPKCGWRQASMHPPRYRESAEAVGTVGGSILRAGCADGCSLRELGRRRGLPGGGKASMRIAAEFAELVEVLADHYQRCDRHGFAGILDPRRRPARKTATS